MNIYQVILHTENGFSFAMPYYFTSQKNAYLYGEYKYRTRQEIRYYEVEKLIDLGKWYLLK